MTKLRRDFPFFRQVDLSKKILEISPSNNPIFSGAKYWGLNDGYNKDDVPLDYTCAIEEVPEHFDYVVSSHVIEHIPDPLGHLISVSKISDSYYFILPDHFYCFDHFKRPSSFLELIEAYMDKRRIHTKHISLEDKLMRTHNDPIRHWNNDHGECPKFDPEKLNKTIDLIQSYKKDALVNAHGWKFRPALFEQFLKMINEAGILKCEYKVIPTAKNDFSFYVSLRF